MFAQAAAIGLCLGVMAAQLLLAIDYQADSAMLHSAEFKTQHPLQA